MKGWLFADPSLLQMKVFYLVLVCCSILVCSCGSGTKEGSQQRVESGNEVEAEDKSSLSRREYAVLSTILSSTPTLVIRSHTKDDYKDHRGELPAEIVNNFPGLSTETVKDYNLKNSTAVPVECKFATATSCTLLAPEEVKSLWDFSTEDASSKWKGFTAKYGTNRYYSVSRVGFNNDGSQALVYVAFECGSLCMDGTLYFLTRQEDGWKISKKEVVSVS